MLFIAILSFGLPLALCGDILGIDSLLNLLICGADDDDALFRDCTYDPTFTAAQIESARVFWQNYVSTGSVPPIRDPCQTIIVRRDFKCLSQTERLAFVNAYKKLWSNGLIDQIAEQFDRYWPGWDKLSEAVTFHTLMLTLVELALPTVDPTVKYIPYWSYYIEGSSPERSVLWNYLGRNGDQFNDFCVRDGNFANVNLYREERCIRREWNSDNTIPKMIPPEVITSILQLSLLNTTKFIPSGWASWFSGLNSIGGFHGDISSKHAPYDPAFIWILSQASGEVFPFQWLYQKPETIDPMFFDAFLRYNYELASLEPANFATDKFNGYYHDYSLAEMQQIGFGDRCVFSNRQIQMALDLQANTRQPPSKAENRLKQQLSAATLAKWFPGFADNTKANVFNVFLPEVGDRNKAKNICRCRPLNTVINFTSTRYGRRMLKRLELDGAAGIPSLNFRSLILEGQDTINEMIADLNREGYCSPYM